MCTYMCNILTQPVLLYCRIDKTVCKKVEMYWEVVNEISCDFTLYEIALQYVTPYLIGQ